MLGLARRGYSFFVARPRARVAVQALISLALIGMLVAMARQANLLASVRLLRPGALMLALGIQVVAFALNSWRWQQLLANTGIRERLGVLAPLYFIGQFFSLFLPTGTGGDIVRAYDVGRRSGRFAPSIMAVLQERLLGLGASLVVGLVAMLYYLPLVPPQLRLWIVVMLVAGAIGIVLLLYPALLFAIAGKLWRAMARRPLMRRMAELPLAARATQALAPIAELPPLPPLRLLLLVTLALIAVLMGISMYYVIGQSLDIGVSFMAFCLVVPLVWIVRMAPVSLNGIGVGEGAFVVLIGLFAVPPDKALVLALAFLGVQTVCALLGGALLAWRVLRGTWSGVRPAAIEPAGEVAHEHR